MKSLLIAATLIVVSSSSNADTGSIDAAANAMNLQQLKRISQQSVGYNLAYAEYRTAITANISGQRGIAKKALSQAQVTLEEILSVKDDAESMALLASVYGMQISLEPSKGQSLGMKADSLLNQAGEINPNNPRIPLIKAVSAFYTPTQYGGGMDKVQQYATQAITLYQQPCDEICWGQTEAYTWRGLAEQELGNQHKAINDWEQAVQIDPNYSWAKFLLKQQTQ